MLYGIIREDYDFETRRYLPVLESMVIFENRQKRDFRFEAYCGESGVLSRWVRFKIGFYSGYKEHAIREDFIEQEE